VCWGSPRNIGHAAPASSVYAQRPSMRARGV
jgi:hypothetical protein